MVRTGLRLVIGSWKIMLISLPRTSRMARSLSLSRSLPWKRIAPPILPGGCGTSRRMELAIAEQVDRKHRDRKENRREEHDVGFDLPQRAAFGHDVAPGWDGGRRAGTD